MVSQFDGEDKILKIKAKVLSISIQKLVDLLALSTSISSKGAAV